MREGFCEEVMRRCLNHRDAFDSEKQEYNFETVVILGTDSEGKYWLEMFFGKLKKMK